jgi:hypothetical protein
MHQAFLELDVRRMCLSHFLLAHLRGTQRLFEEPKDKRCAPFLAVYAACLVAIARPVRCCPADAGAGAANPQSVPRSSVSLRSAALLTVQPRSH